MIGYSIGKEVHVGHRPTDIVGVRPHMHANGDVLEAEPPGSQQPDPLVSERRRSLANAVPSGVQRVGVEVRIGEEPLGPGIIRTPSSDAADGSGNWRRELGMPWKNSTGRP